MNSLQIRIQQHSIDMATEILRLRVVLGHRFLVRSFHENRGEIDLIERFGLKHIARNFTSGETKFAGLEGTT